MFKRALRAPLLRGGANSAGPLTQTSEYRNCLILVSHAKSDNEYLDCFVFLRMDIAESQLLVKMSALFKNKENADVSLVCEGKTILAHSTILELRWNSLVSRSVMLWCMHLKN